MGNYASANAQRAQNKDFGQGYLSRTALNSNFDNMRFAQRQGESHPSRIRLKRINRELGIEQSLEGPDI